MTDDGARHGTRLGDDEELRDVDEGCEDAGLRVHKQAVSRRLVRVTDLGVRHAGEVLRTMKIMTHRFSGTVLQTGKVSAKGMT